MSVTSRRDYGWITDQIREDAVEAVLIGVASGLSLHAASAKVAAELEVHTNTVKNWAIQSGRLDPDNRVVAELTAEVDTLRALNTRLRQTLRDRQGRG